MKTYEKIMLENLSWANEKKTLDKNYFARFTQLENPEFLWIGSSDSVVPIKEITNTEPGEIIAHRNMGNVVNADDECLMTLLEFAIRKFKVKHIVICGHNHCWGIRSVLDSDYYLPHSEKWLGSIKKVYEANQREIDALPEDQKELQLAKLNVVEQIDRLYNLPIIKEIWGKDGCPRLHGWVYDVSNGLLESLKEMDPQEA
ncbi:MAG: carbonic anhydrase [Bacteroidota bacterium]